MDTLILIPGQIWIGFTLGMVYALLAVGFTMVYGILNMMNFAHGEVYMFAAFASWAVLNYSLGTPLDTAPAAFILPLMVIAAILAGALVAMFVERICFRPLYARQSGRLPPIIAAVGVALALRQLMVVIQNEAIGNVRVRTVEYWEIIPRSWNWHVPGIDIFFTATALVIIAITLLAMIIVGYYVTETTGGKAMRAAAQDPEATRAMGVNLDQTIVMTFVIGAVLAAIGGVFIGFHFGQVETFMGFPAVIKAFIASVIGGVGSIRGAVLGGIVLGCSEGIWTTFLGSNWKDVITFCLLIVLLMYRPRGLLGEHVDVYERA